MRKIFKKVIHYNLIHKDTVSTNADIVKLYKVKVINFREIFYIDKCDFSKCNDLFNFIINGRKGLMPYNFNQFWFGRPQRKCLLSVWFNVLFSN